MTLLHSGANKRYGVLLAIVCFLSLFLFLGETLFNTRGEPREAIVAVSMLQDGNWILPVNNGVDMAYKPPFFHWLIALVSLLPGQVSEFTARFPSALALWVMVMAGYAFYARRRGAEVAFLMGMITFTNFEVHRAGVACRVDMVLTLMMVLSLYQLYRWIERDLKGLPWLGILTLSGAFLSKGPVGLGLPCIVAALFALIRGKGFVRIFMRFLVVGLLSCVLPLVWYVAAYQQGGQRFLDLIYEENVLRLLGKMSYESHVNPWYYNVMTIVTGFVPYTLLVLMSLIVLKYSKPTWQLSPSRWWSSLKRYVREMDDTRLFTLLSFAVIFVFYCIPKSKRSVYLLPCYPFLAYFLAEYILWLRDRHRRVLVVFGRVVGALCLLLPVAFIIVRLGLVPETVFSGKHAAQNIAMLAALRDTPLDFVQLAAFLLPLYALYRFARPVRGGESTIYSMMVCIFALFFSLDGLYQPLVLNSKSDKPIADKIARYVPEGKVYSYRAEYVPGNPLHPFTINYYLGDRVVPFHVTQPAAGYLIVPDRDIDTFRTQYPQYQVKEVEDFHHRSCDDRRMIHFYHFSKP